MRSIGIFILSDRNRHLIVAIMNGHTVESLTHLTDSGIDAAKKTVQDEPGMKELDASKLTVTKTSNPREIPEVNSHECVFTYVSPLLMVRSDLEHVCVPVSSGWMLFEDITDLNRVWDMKTCTDHSK